MLDAPYTARTGQEILTVLHSLGFSGLGLRV